MNITQEQFNAILTVLTAKPGFSVDLFCRLMVRSLEDGQFAVTLFDDRGKEEDEMIFVDPTKAVEYFLNLREQLQLGVDFEVTR